MNYKKHPIKLFSLSCVFLLLFAACEEHVINDDTTTPVVVDCNPAVSLATDITPIIQTRCVSCHNGSQPPNLTSNSRIQNNAASIKAAVVSRRMPLGGSLTTEQIDAIRCWVDNGAQDN